MVTPNFKPSGWVTEEDVEAQLHEAARTCTPEPRRMNPVDTQCVGELRWDF